MCATNKRREPYFWNGERLLLAFPLFARCASNARGLRFRDAHWSVTSQQCACTRARYRKKIGLIFATMLTIFYLSGFNVLGCGFVYLHLVGARLVKMSCQRNYRSINILYINLAVLKSPFSNLSQVSGLRQRVTGKHKFIFTRDELFWINSLAYLVWDRIRWENGQSRSEPPGLKGKAKKNMPITQIADQTRADMKV